MLSRAHHSEDERCDTRCHRLLLPRRNLAADLKSKPRLPEPWRRATILFRLVAILVSKLRCAPARVDDVDNRVGVFSDDLIEPLPINSGRCDAVLAAPSVRLALLERAALGCTVPRHGRGTTERPLDVLR